MTLAGTTRVTSSGGLRRLSRRVLLRGIAGVSASLPIAGLLAACGGSKAAPPNPKSAATTSSSASSASSSSAASSTTGASTPSGGVGATPAVQASGSAPASQAASSGGTPKSGGTLEVGVNSDFLTLDPAMSTAFIDREFFYQVFTPLVQLNLDTSFAPGLAEKWEVKDPKTYIFTLRQGVKFHDGTVLDSSVAKWNFARMQDKSSGSERISELSPVQQVVASSPNTIELQLNAPYAPLLATLTDRAGMMVSEAAAKKYGKNFATNPVGTGPFQFVEWKQQDHLTVKRFDGYYESGKPYLDQIIYHPVENQEVQLTNLRTGQMQFIDNVAPKDLSTITSNSSLKLYQKPGLNYHYFDLNNAKPPFNNKALRQAVAWAVDRASVHKIIYYQTGAIAQGPLAPTSWAYDPNFKPYSPTPAKVKASLAAGSQPNGFSFTLITVATPAELQFTQLVQSQLKAVGITMKIQSAENSALSNALTTGDFEAVHAAWSGRVDPDGNMFYYYTKDGSFNFRKYYNPKVESLLTEARQETDQNKRKQLYLQAQVLVVDDAPLVYFHHNAILHGTSTKLHGYEVYPDGMMRFGDNWLE